MQKRMYKVICPMEKDGVVRYWMRCGSAFTNKDESINLYLEALPLNQKEVKLQLREVTEAELAEAAERRASFAATRGNPGSSSDGGLGGAAAGASPLAASGLPF
jgi:hypothetical protein